MRAELAALIEAADAYLRGPSITSSRYDTAHEVLAGELGIALAAARKVLKEPDQLAAALAHDATSIGIADNLLQQLTEAKADVAKVIRARNFYEQLWKEAEGKLTAALKEAAPEGLASELEKDAEHLGDTGLHGIAMRVEQAAAALRRPEGVWVPKEPTEAMIEAWDRPKAGGQSFHHLFVANYKAMLAAAQEEKAS